MRPRVRLLERFLAGTVDLQGQWKREAEAECGLKRQSCNHKVATSHLLSLFINVAAAAAPKPLSMFTTVMPGAHELSIASNAARPLKLAP